MNINQLKLEIHDNYKNDEKVTTTFRAVNDSDVINKPYLDEKVSKKDGHLSFLKKHYAEILLLYNKQSAGKTLIRKVVKTTIQILYDKGLFDSFPEADKVSKNFIFVTRRRADLEKANVDIQYDFFPKYILQIKATSNINIR